MLQVSKIFVDNKRISDSAGTVVTDEKNPVFSFQIESDRNATKVVAANVEVNGWKEAVSDIRNIVYSGKPLESFKEYDIKVQIRDEKEEIAIKTASFMTGRQSGLRIKILKLKVQYHHSLLFFEEICISIMIKQNVLLLQQLWEFMTCT